MLNNLAEERANKTISKSIKSCEFISNEIESLLFETLQKSSAFIIFSIILMTYFECLS